MQKSLIVFALLFSVAVRSQTVNGKNMAKLNLSALAIKGFNVQYERQVLRRVTIAAGFGLIPVSSLPFKSYIRKQVYIPNADVKNYRAGNTVFTPEVRFYVGKKGGFHGFYFAPYARAGFYKIKGPITYSNSAEEDKSADFSGKLNAITGGLLIGCCWQLPGRFYLDWWIAGAGFGGENGKFTAAAALTPDDQNALQKSLNSISLAGVKLTSAVNSSGAIIKTSGSMVGLRGLGINVGIRF